MPGIVSESIVNGTPVPKKLSRARAAAPLTVECPDGYSGCDGVTPRNGAHVGSAPAGVPDGPDNWMAVTGRQNT